MKVTSGQLLYRSKTTDPIIEIRENRKSRWMHFDNPFFQTLIDKNKPHRLMLDHMPIMLAVLYFLVPPQKILLAGLGGGGLVHYLQYYYPKINLTTIEINEEIIKLAKEYFYLPRESNTCSMINADINDYFSQTKESYDLILMDMYTSNDVPNCCFQENFYQQAYQHLNPQGIMVANLLCHTAVDFLKILAKIRLAFDNRTLCFPVTNYQNLIVYAFKDKDYLDKIYQLMDQNILSSVELDSNVGLSAQTIKPVTFPTRPSAEHLYHK